MNTYFPMNTLKSVTNHLPLDLCLIDWGNAKLKMYRAAIGATTGNVREIDIVV